MSTEFKSWEEMSRQEQLSSIYSDMYKDVHGFRPRGYTTMSESELEKALDSLSAELESVIDEEQADQQRAVAKFEASVESTIASGATDRKTAIKWLLEADGLEADSSFDREHYEFRRGLPYGYLNQVS